MVQNLKEYSMQLREMHQTQIDIRQNEIMKIFLQNVKPCCFSNYAKTDPKPHKKIYEAPKNVTISKEELTVPLIDQYYLKLR